MDKKQIELDILNKLLVEAKGSVQSHCRCKTLDRYDEFIELFIERVKDETR